MQILIPSRHPALRSYRSIFKRPSWSLLAADKAKRTAISATASSNTPGVLPNLIPRFFNSGTSILLTPADIAPTVFIWAPETQTKQQMLREDLRKSKSLPALSKNFCIESFFSRPKNRVDSCHFFQNRGSLLVFDTYKLTSEISVLNDFFFL
jgi:hypothetical protein